MTCPKCGHPGTITELMSEGHPHHAKLSCAGPDHHFLKWLPRPRPPIDQVNPPGGVALGDPLPQLVGTPAQISYAESVRPGVLAMLWACEVPARVYRAARGITDSSFWIASRDARKPEEVRWPASWTKPEAGP